MNSRRLIRKSIFAPILTIIVASLAVCTFIVRDAQSPNISCDTSQYIRSTPIVIEFTDEKSGLQKAHYEIRQGEKIIKSEDIVFDTFKDAKTYNDTINFETSELNIEDGELTINVTAIDWGWFGGNQNTAVFEFIVDTKPPTIDVVSRTHYINQGGSGMVVFNVSEDTIKAGVIVNNLEVPAFIQKNGRYAALIPFPHYVSKIDDFKPVVFAEDEAGNRAKAGFYYFSNARPFRKDKVTVSDAFLDIVTPQFSDKAGHDKSPIDIFLYVNQELRKENRAELASFAEKTSSEPLWRGAFIRNKGANKAKFGDNRTYLYGGEAVDNQTHLGVDIAANANYPVEAANDGVIAYTGFLGIYGNCVVIDHGLGLQTLYAHLANISDVHVGDNIKKGDIVGKSGATGMAGGDHLHFAVLISGVPVNPIEWWDETWVKNNIESKQQLFEVNND